MYTNINTNLVIDILNNPQYDISNKALVLRDFTKTSEIHDIHLLGQNLSSKERFSNG
jgi:hypothetical protein